MQELATIDGGRRAQAYCDMPLIVHEQTLHASAGCVHQGAEQGVAHTVREAIRL